MLISAAKARKPAKIETVRNPDAKPAERCFAKLGFALGIVGFAFGTAAMLVSMPAFAGVALKLPGLLPLATKVANLMGISGMLAWGGQLFLGKNAWLNARLSGTLLG